jgi:hypothetical protein
VRLVGYLKRNYCLLDIHLHFSFIRSPVENVKLDYIGKYDVDFLKWNIPVVLKMLKYNINIYNIIRSYTTLYFIRLYKVIIPAKCFGLIDNAFNLRDLANWKHYQLYTPPIQRSAWRWPYNRAETCSWNYNLI